MIDDKLRNTLGLAERKLREVSAGWARLEARGVTAEDRAAAVVSTTRMRTELANLIEQVRPWAPAELANMVDELVAKIDQLIMSIKGRTLH